MQKTGRAPKSKMIAWMAMRQVTAKKGYRLSVMTTISVLGVAIGVSALVIVLSVMAGFEKDLKAKMFRGLPHLEILDKRVSSGFSLEQYPLTKMQKLFPEATGVEAFTKADVVLKQGKNIASVTLFGIDPAAGGKLWGFHEGMLKGELQALAEARDELPGIVLGEGLASTLLSGIGDEVHILNPQLGIVDALSGNTVSGIFRVVGIFQTDLPQYDTRYAVVSLGEGRKFMPDYDYSLDEEQFVTGVALNFTKPENIDDYLGRVAELGELEVVTWKTVNRSLLAALKLEKFTMGAILLLIVLVAAFSISGTMMMTVFHKRREVALLRSLGMSRKGITQLFLAHGLTIGTIGAVLGLVLGIGVCTLIYYFQFVDLPVGVYYQKKLPVEFLPLEYLLISFSAWTLSLIAAVYPALIAAKQDPGNGLRYV